MEEEGGMIRGTVVVLFEVWEEEGFRGTVAEFLFIFVLFEERLLNR